VSRSYSYPYAAVAWHDGPVGIDIERVEECDAEFAASICTPAERRAWAGAADVDGFFASVWCSKEALAKALGDALRYDPRRLETPIRWRHGTAGPWRARQLELAPRHVAWLCWRAEGC
jgi:phosphopantetheinyl transferase